MTRTSIMVAFATLCIVAAGYYIADKLRPAPSTPVSGPLVIYSSTDVSAFQPVLDEFRKANPDIKIAYLELDAATVYSRFLAELTAGQNSADLLLSAATDLQVELVNRGYADAHRSAVAETIPRWAQWRSEVFGFTIEPVVTVFNTALMGGRPIPKSRPELLAALNADPGFWQGRIATYDIARSSVGYMLAAQDARQGGNAGALLAAFGALDVRAIEGSTNLLSALERGEVAMAYNVLGSYALGRVARGADLTIVYPQDYTLAVSRSALVPKSAPHPKAAHAFLEFLLSPLGQSFLTRENFITAVRPEIAPPPGQPDIRGTGVGPVRPISLGPGLLVQLDSLKKRQLMQDWAATLRRPLE